MLTLSKDEMPRPLKLREGMDRRRQDDRRQSPVDMRLRVGLWYQYHRATRSGEFDPLPRNQYKRSKLLEALLPEMQKYDFAQRDANSPVPPSCALSMAVDFLWSQPTLGCNAAGEPMAVYTINAISDCLVRTFQVSAIDRRASDRRAAPPPAS